MSFLTQPTRINELLVDSDQTWISRKSMTIPSGATFSQRGRLDNSGTLANTGTVDSSGGTYLSRETTASYDSTNLADGEFAVGDVSTSSAVLYFRSGSTTYRFIADDGSAL